MFSIEYCLLKVWICPDIEIMYFLLLNLLENCLERGNLLGLSFQHCVNGNNFFCSSIMLNAKVYYRAGKGWTDIVSIFVT